MLIQMDVLDPDFDTRLDLLLWYTIFWHNDRVTIVDINSKHLRVRL